MGTDKSKKPNIKFPFFSDPCPSVLSAVKLFLIDSLHFVTFASFCSKIFSSVPLSSRHREIWCQSLIEFDRLRPFLVFHRLYEATFHFSVVKKFARVHQTSREFD